MGREHMEHPWSGFLLNFKSEILKLLLTMFRHSPEKFET